MSEINFSLNESKFIKNKEMWQMKYEERESKRNRARRRRG
jgi:hypothetical protein